MTPDPPRRHDPRALLSTLWTVAVLSYLYCDVVGHMDAAILRDLLGGEIDGTVITQGFLLGASALMLVPIAMVLLARVLPHRANRWANVAAGALMTVVQLASLTVGTPTAYYLLFSVVEVTVTAFVVWYAWTWRSPAHASAEVARPLHAAA